MSKPAGSAGQLLRSIAELIALPSISSPLPALDQSNRPVIDYLASRLEECGCAVRIQPIPGVAGKFNLIASIGEGAGGLVLAGHTDTVPCNPALWSTDPFRAVEREQRIHGLGTADMKSFFALVLAILPELDSRRMQAPLLILATADEESSMAGARALAAGGELPGRYAVIGEPTGLRPVRSHKGILMERLLIDGQSGHSSNPALGNSALEGMQRAMAALLDWRRSLQASARDERFPVPVTTLNLGRIAGGDNANRICGHCELDLDLRPLPGPSLAALRGELRQRVDAVLAGSGLSVSHESLFAGIEGLDTPAESELVRFAEALTGVEAGAVDFATEGPLLSALGKEVLIFGPGSVAQAHRPDEYLELAAIEPMLGHLRALIQRFCYG